MKAFKATHKRLDIPTSTLTHLNVSTDLICSAIQLVYEDTRSIKEPAGALAVAGLYRWLQTHREKDRKLVAI